MLSKHNSRGFTLIEVVISVLVLSMFITIIMYLYSRSSDSFKITLWKQERTAQAELFWSYMRKHLEEATNDISFSMGTPNPSLTEILCPFKFHPDPNSAPSGSNVLAWNVTKTNFVYSPPYNHSSVSQKFFLSKDKHRLVLRSADRDIASIDDVSRVEFIVVSVVKNPANEEEIVPGFAPGAVGSLFEISITLAPPEKYIASNLRLPQNHKFRLNVAPQPDSSPSY